MKWWPWLLALSGFFPVLWLDPYTLWLHETLQRFGWIEDVVQALREFGGLWGASLILLMAAALDPPRRRRLAVAAAAVGITYLTTSVVKITAGRFRPDAQSGVFAFSGPRGAWLDDRRKSFPSGHSGQAFALAAVLAHTYPKARRGFYLLASGCALSRVIEARHFPSDVYVGTLIGLLWAHGLVALEARRATPQPGGALN